MKRTCAILSLLWAACGAPASTPSAPDAALAPDATSRSDVEPLDAAAPPPEAGIADAGPGEDAAVPEAPDSGLAPLAPNRWERIQVEAPVVVWEHGAAYDPGARRFVQTGGHVLGGYPQSSYSFLFDPWQARYALSLSPRRPQRMCLVDQVYVDSLERMLLSQGSVEHGSLSSGGLSADATSIDWSYRTRPPAGPWLYDARGERWEDARILGTTMGSRFHSQLAYDAGSDLVAYLLDTSLSLYSPRQNQAWQVPLPLELQGRRSYGIAADPELRKFYVFGGSSQSPSSFWMNAPDPAAAYAAQVKDDLWEYDVASGSFRQILGPAPPRGMPTADFMRVPLVYDAGSRALFTLQTATSSAVLGGFMAWPRPELWRFDLETQRWSLHETEEVPRFPGLLRLGPGGRLFLFGGGGDGDSQRPATSREVYWLKPEVQGRAPSPRPPPRPELADIRGAEVELRFPAAVPLEVFRARTNRAAGAEEKLSPAPITSGSFIDRSAEAGIAYAYRIRRVSGGPYSLPVFTQPARPSGLSAEVESAAQVHLRWEASPDPSLRYHVYRARGRGAPEQITAAPIVGPRFDDMEPGLEDGVIRRYYVTALNAAGLESGPSPLAYSVPEAPRWFQSAAIDPITVELRWDGADGLGVEIYYVDHHLNTLSLPNEEIDAWIAAWTKVTPAPVQGGVWRFTIPEASRAQPSAYFFARAVNVLGQPGFITDLSSPQDLRFAPATPERPEWPRR
ncbi:MAG: hypothetical protein U1E65_29670 [Myxococcota bacterium]